MRATVRVHGGQLKTSKGETRSGYMESEVNKCREKQQNLWR